ncbi:Fc receptor-like protein 5 isoform X2 [Marmota monax]|uniref:Fc receptor-like protein 5 isoform X2 n=1 Tax=Marmota monax TaxID=9995 RepID=UPI001EAF980D|nr:Fc receptor-like protein 5 isoform X2 [Marmota monax]
MRKLVFGSQVLVVPVFMLLWVTLLVLVTPSKSIISLQFPWTVFFQGESMDLTCKGSSSHSPWTTKWYFEGKVFKKNPKSTLRVRESGDYKCQADGLPVSDPVHLEFSTAPLILQGPPYVFEGDSVLLRCRTKAKTKLNTVAFFKNGELLILPNNSSDLHIDGADLVHNGHYHCGGYIHTCCTASSNRVNIRVQELFTHPVLRSSSSKPTEGSPVTLTCQTQLPPERSDVQLQFCFFRDGQALGSGWRISPELRIPALGTEDSGSYWCQAKRVNSHILKESRKISIPVRAAVSQPVLTLNPAKNWLLEGTWLTLHCEVQRGSPPILYKFYHDSVSLGSSSTPSTGRASLGISLTAQHSGFYYCTADNGFSPQRSEAVRLSVLVPLSRPVLTRRAPMSQPVVGDVMELHCEALSGLLPITYTFYRDDITLGRRVAYSRGGVSFRLPVTAEHSGNYFCKASNSAQTQHSDTMTLTVISLSRPVLTLRDPSVQPVVGDVMELHCESLSGSLPITYTFYHEDVTLGSIKAHSRGGAYLSVSVTAEHSGNYFCEASNSAQTQRSDTMTLTVKIPVSRPVLTLRDPSIQPVVGDVMQLHCESLSGSLPITYTFYHEDVNLGSRKAHSRGGASFSLAVTAEHSGNYFCEASNSVQTQRSDSMTLTVKIPVSRPVLTLRDPSVRLVVGDVMELRCEALSGSPPILYKFYHEDVTLGSTMAPSGGGASFNLSLMEKHSGNYSCEAENDLEIQHSELVTVIVTVPVSRPVLTLRAPRAQAEVGDVVELHCEALRGSPPILYQFYHEDVTLGNSSAPSGGGASFNLFLTAEHSGNYSCEADNGQGAQRSEAVALFIPGLTESRSGPVAPGVTGGLLGTVVLAAGALLFYHWLSRKAGGRTASDPSRHSSDSNPQDPTYHNVPGWIELQPVYMNVNSRGEDVVYSEVSCLQKESRNSAASAHSLSHQTDSSVIYAKVKKACTPASGPHQLASPAPHR